MRSASRPRGGADGATGGGLPVRPRLRELGGRHAGQSSTEPVLNVYARSVDEGNAPGTVDLAVHLDAPAAESRSPATSRCSARPPAAPAIAMEKVTFAPGRDLQGRHRAAARRHRRQHLGEHLGEGQRHQHLRGGDGQAGDRLHPASVRTTACSHRQRTRSRRALRVRTARPAHVCAELATVLAGGQVEAPGVVTAGQRVGAGSRRFPRRRDRHLHRSRHRAR